jgi:predicted PurR-regulated permease PerM
MRRIDKSIFKKQKMRAKNIFRIAAFVIFIAFALPASSTIIVPVTSKTSSPPNTENPRAQQLIQRLEEINGMNKSEMTRLEKKGLRKEVKEIKKEMKVISGGVYLSVGAIIIIILLLILLL